MKFSKLITIVIAIAATIPSAKAASPLTEGLWRGAFALPSVEIPFTFEIKGSGTGNLSVSLINGSDRFITEQVKYQDDSLIVSIDLYNTMLKAKVSGKTMRGNFYKLSSNPVLVIPFEAQQGSMPRFAEGAAPLVSMNGTWDIDMNSDEKNIGAFEQKGALTTGSILTPTGDFRFMEGAVHGKEFGLSAFGGSTPFMIKGRFTDENTFNGEYISPYKTTPISGKRNPNATLPDAYNVSYLRPGYSGITFSFPNLEGKLISLSDPKYKGKAVIVSILGSWCPNCLDEHKFLSAWYNENHERGVEIIGLGFERKDDFAEASKALNSLKERLGIQYEILFAGKADKETASRALPQLNKVASFPTTIFIDRKGNVRKVHSGFSGPATGKFFDEFKAEFKQLTDQLINEH